ncbi:hypothetical protein XFLAVUS301_38140 [Xanthobacter flavus]|uniref:Uncharacterized protein n=1 Tax=Xanthobacter flavus TaxID=281 RepID=A0A9W6CQY2_XANFL|nr:hypothetical protein XFLAVUS301_38140 [Xanthobacter flavus]
MGKTRKAGQKAREFGGPASGGRDGAGADAQRVLSSSLKPKAHGPLTRMGRADSMARAEGPAGGECLPSPLAGEGVGVRGLPGLGEAPDKGRHTPHPIPLPQGERGLTPPHAR